MSEATECLVSKSQVDVLLDKSLAGDLAVKCSCIIKG